MNRSDQTGFSAVELLITIFVAAAFLAAGYQLYSAVLRNGADTRNQTIASNIAYDYVRRYSSQATNPCTVVSPVPAPTIPTPPTGGASLPSPSITASITCPYGAANGTSLVSVTVTYGYTTPQKQVQHAVYVTN